MDELQYGQDVETIYRAAEAQEAATEGVNLQGLQNLSAPGTAEIPVSVGGQYVNGTLVGDGVYITVTPDGAGKLTISFTLVLGGMATKAVAGAVANLTTLTSSDLPVSNPPTQAEVQAIRDAVIGNRDKLNALLTSLRGATHIAT